MPKRTSASGSELFIVDNSDQDWKVLRYLHDWCQISCEIDVADNSLHVQKVDPHWRFYKPVINRLVDRIAKNNPWK